MLTTYSLLILFTSVLGIILAIPPNTCIVIVHLETIRKKEKLSPSDVIFLAKAIVNILHQCVLSLQGMLIVSSVSTLYNGEVQVYIIVSNFFLIYYSFWLTVWLSAHYCTSITNLRYGFFIWIKRTVSNFLSRILFLSALLFFALSIISMWSMNPEINILSSENSTAEDSITNIHYHINYFTFLPSVTIGCILPFCLTLLCLLLTFSFLVRHVWRVKNNDSGSSRPNLQAHVTALRTIFLLLLMLTFFFVSQVLLFSVNSTKLTDTIPTIIWILRSYCPLSDTAIIFQASLKLRRILGGMFWPRSCRNTET